MAGEHDEARRTAVDACAAFRQAGPRHTSYSGECETWVAEHGRRGTSISPRE